MKARTYINRKIIANNKKTGRNDPPISVRTYKGVKHVHGFELEGPCKIIYSPDKPLSCGATVWIETELNLSDFNNLLS